MRTTVSRWPTRSSSTMTATAKCTCRWHRSTRVSRRWKEAGGNIDKAAALPTHGDDDSRYVLFLRGALEERQKHFDAAEEQFRKILALDPNNSMTLNYLGYMLADRGVKLDDALAMLQKAVQLDPQNYAYLDSLGWVYYKLGQYPLAEENLRKASERVSTDPTVHDHLGELYEKTGRLRLAVAQWDQSLAQYARTVPADVDEGDVSKVQKKLENAKGEAGPRICARHGSEALTRIVGFRGTSRTRVNQPHTTSRFVPLPAACAVSSDPAEPLTARTYSEPSHAYRSPFQRDRARIIHSRAFRRLAGKTQVFTHGDSDHYRSRLTHTIEVTQLARTIAAALGLNGDLTESLALVHDIGHPPFGHAGERALDEAMRAHGLRFDHNLHALRIVTVFEQRYVAFPGLNLTLGVREGIIKHSRDYDPVEYPGACGIFPRSAAAAGSAAHRPGRRDCLSNGRFR